MASYYATIKADRDEWKRQRLGESRTCPICRKTSHLPRDCHEMVRRSHAPRQWGVRSNYLLVCRTCHDTIIPSMPLAKQLAYKLMTDPDHFDLEEVNEIKGGEPVRMRDVVRYLELRY